MEHHPQRELLEHYAAGSLPLAFALCVSVHLSFCPQCRAEVGALQNLGGLLFEKLEPVAVDAAALQSVWAKIDAAAAHGVAVAEPVTEAVPTATAAAASIPKPLRALLPGGYDGVRWSRLLPGLRAATLDVGDSEHVVALHRLQPGGKVPRHDHRGTEITIVLNGSFSDEYGVYRDGDFIVREPADVHQPLVARNEECICLAAQAAPVRFTQHFWRLLNPLLS